ncbi:olfactory receptor 4Q2-like [Oreochromis aureus]|uniref:olfactory receptor 4Q2-like n=1 Tax=Oreochromis aureus TaxID=47969 RepID=UPI0019530BE7|nr:olfactory receptor 4Q2-like [Oreochromis aureus]
MYIFIAALLLNSVLYSTTVYPKLLIDFSSEKQVTTYSACLFQFFIFYTLVLSEFLLLAAMAYDRYVAICKPLEYQTIMRKTTVGIFLVVAWLVPACHVAVQAIASAEAKLCDSNIKGIFCNNAVYTLQCQRSRLITIFGVVIVLDLAMLPMLFIVFTYTKIFIVSHRSCKEIRKKAAETCLPHLLVLLSLSVFFVVVRRVGQEYQVIEAGRIEGQQSAQRAEVIALIRALRLAKNLKVNIYTDSAYAFGAAQVELAQWKRAGYRTATNAPICHKKEMEELEKALEDPDEVSIVKCKGHSQGDNPVARGNRTADEAAKKAAGYKGQRQMVQVTAEEEGSTNTLEEVRQAQKEASPEERGVAG